MEASNIGEVTLITGHTSGVKEDKGTKGPVSRRNKIGTLSVLFQTKAIDKAEVQGHIHFF
jgi:hypothetical protein